MGSLRSRYVAAWVPVWLALATPGVLADFTFAPALPVTEPGGMDLMDIAACGGYFLVAGERGLIARSDDAGATWQQQSVPVSQHLTGVDCADAERALAVGHGGAILASNDGGQSWTLKFDGNAANDQWLAYTKQRVIELDAAVEAAGDAADGDLIYAQEDAVFAVEDAIEAQQNGPVDPFLDVLFIDERRAIAAGAYGMLYRSLDGGESWQLAAGGIDNPDRYHYYALANGADGTLYLSGEAGLLYRSTDAGANWQRLDPGYDGSLFGLVVEPEGAVVAFGLRGNALRSSDGGETWTAVSIADDPRLSLYGGGRLADGTVVLVGAGGVLLHRAPGSPEYAPASMPGRSTLSAIAGADLSTAIAVGLSGTAPAREALQ